MTDGGTGGTSGGRRRTWLIGWLSFAAIGGVSASINAVSVIDDRARVGHPVPAWEPWTWELTSLVAWLMLVPLVFLVTRRLRPPRHRWPAVIAGHGLASLLGSLAHVSLMTLFRHAAYAALGESYGGDPLGDIFLYEYRKDLATYAAIVLLLILIDRLRAASAEPAAAPAAAETRIEIRDGSRTIWLAPGDIEWAQAAGNYVELHGAFGTLLHRRTLAALEKELAPHGFRRVHRSRLVRAAAVQAIETRQSGDFEILLASGERIVGSRRFRQGLG